MLTMKWFQVFGASLPIKMAAVEAVGRDHPQSLLSFLSILPKAEVGRQGMEVFSTDSGLAIFNKSITSNGLPCGNCQRKENTFELLVAANANPKPVTPLRRVTAYGSSQRALGCQLKATL